MRVESAIESNIVPLDENSGPEDIPEPESRPKKRRTLSIPILEKKETPPSLVYDRPELFLSTSGKPFMWRQDADLHISGSGSLSAKSIEFLANRFPDANGLCLLSLQQEFQIITPDGSAMTKFQPPHNDINKGKTTNEIIDAENKELKKLNKKSEEGDITVRSFHAWGMKYSRRQEENVFKYALKSIRQKAWEKTLGTEKKWPKGTQFKSVAEVCEKNGIKNKRLPFTDHGLPSDEQLVELKEIVDDLPPNTHLHCQCKGGNGRTTFTLYTVAMFKLEKDIQKETYRDFQDFMKKHKNLRKGYFMRGIHLTYDPKPANFERLESIFEQVKEGKFQRKIAPSRKERAEAARAVRSARTVRITPDEHNEKRLHAPNIVPRDYRGR